MKLRTTVVVSQAQLLLDNYRARSLSKAKRNLHLFLFLGGLFGLSLQSALADIIDIDFGQTPPPSGTNPVLCWRTDTSYWRQKYGVILGDNIINYGGYGQYANGTITDTHCWDQTIAAISPIAWGGGAIGFDSDRISNVSSISLTVGAWCRVWITDPVTGRIVDVTFDHFDVNIEGYTNDGQIIKATAARANNTPLTISAPQGTSFTGAEMYGTIGEAKCSLGGLTLVSDLKIQTGPSQSLDLSIGQIALAQPSGTPLVQDSNGNYIVGTVTPPTAVPAPKISSTPVLAQVTVNMTGTPSANASAILQLSMNGQNIASQSVNLGTLHSGVNVVGVSYIPPTDPSLLGTSVLTATINANKAVQESSYTNNSNSVPINTMVLCKVEDAGRSVPFWSQADAAWASQVFGIKENSSSKNPTMQKFGCSVTDLAMLFSSYGIKNTPKGSPDYPASTDPFNPPLGLDGGLLNPGSLDYAMANYTTPFIDTGSVGFDGHNDPIWAGAAQIARAGYEAQCADPANNCDPTNANNVVSFKKMLPAYDSEKDAISGIQNEVCAGNPVILKFSKATGGQHFMLATGIVLDKAQNRTLSLNNPGVRDAEIGRSAFYSALKTAYPSITGGVLYRPSSDPTMLFLAAPSNVDFVVTDSQGRRAGYNPLTGATYSEIPGATYETQSIDTPNESGFTPETLVSEKYFVSSYDVTVGNYQVNVYSVSGGNYYLDYHGFDAVGISNKVIVNAGTLRAGQSATVSILHSDQTAPVSNAKMDLKQYRIHGTKKGGFSDSRVKVAGVMKPISKIALNFESGFNLMIGGVGACSFNIPSSAFKMSKEGKKAVYEYHSKDIDVRVKSDGDYKIDLRRVDLANVNQKDLNFLTIQIGNYIGQSKNGFECRQERCALLDDADADSDID